MIDINKLIKDALKNKRKDNLKAYRNIKTEFLKYIKSDPPKELSSKAQVQILQTMVKNLKKSEEAYKQAHRQDLADECIIERLIIQDLLPKPESTEFIKLWLSTLDWVKSDPITGNFEIPKNKMSETIKTLKIHFPYNNGGELAQLVKEYIV